MVMDADSLPFVVFLQSISILYKVFADVKLTDFETPNWFSWRR